MSLVPLLEELQDARRNAYVSALIAGETGRTVVGHLGWIPTAELWAVGAWPIPIVSQDDTTLSYTKEVSEPICPPLRATIGYAMKDKCPLIHASQTVVINTLCPQRETVVPHLSGKEILRFHPSQESEFIREVYLRFGEPEAENLSRVRETLNAIDHNLEVLARHVATGQITFREWAILQDGIRFLPELYEQMTALEKAIHIATQRPARDTKRIALTYATVDGVDAEALQKFDEYRIELHRLDCEKSADVARICGLPFLMENCRHIDKQEPFTLHMSQPDHAWLTSIETRLQSQEEIQ